MEKPIYNIPRRAPDISIMFSHTQVVNGSSMAY